MVGFDHRDTQNKASIVTTAGVSEISVTPLVTGFLRLMDSSLRITATDDLPCEAHGCAIFPLRPPDMTGVEWEKNFHHGASSRLEPHSFPTPWCPPEIAFEIAWVGIYLQ
jgi:hypothetical protein